MYPAMVSFRETDVEKKCADRLFLVICREGFVMTAFVHGPSVVCWRREVEMALVGRRQNSVHASARHQEGVGFRGARHE
jgi:hypothetical protein